MDVTCKLCKKVSQIDESEYISGSEIVLQCPRCGEENIVAIPGKQETANIQREVAVVKNECEVVSATSEVNSNLNPSVGNVDVELEKARLMLEAERLRLENRRMNHEEKKLDAQLQLQSKSRYEQYGDEYNDKPVKSRTTAALLAIFLGGLGIHKFYLGKNTSGIVYLLFCWTYIPGLIALVEGIIYLTKSDKQFQNDY